MPGAHPGRPRPGPARRDGAAVTKAWVEPGGVTRVEGPGSTPGG